jgi:hypothetical protein
MRGLHFTTYKRTVVHFYAFQPLQFNKFPFLCTIGKKCKVSHHRNLVLLIYLLYFNYLKIYLWVIFVNFFSTFESPNHNTSFQYHLLWYCLNLVFWGELKVFIKLIKNKEAKWTILIKFPNIIQFHYAEVLYIINCLNV